MGELENLRKKVADLEAKVGALEVKERALAESEKRHKLINRLVTDKIYAFKVEEDGRIELVDPVSGVVGEITGYSIDETRKMEEWRKVVHPDDWPIVKRGLAEMKVGRHCEAEIRLVSKTGTVTWQKIIGVPEWDVEKDRLRGGYWCLKDITAQKRSEEEMLRLERLRALGQMAAGISHNLNNILTTIMGPAKLLERAIEDPDLKQETDYISRSARRARDLVRRLNEAIRGGVDPTIRAVPVEQVVNEAIDLTRSMWKDEPESRGAEIRLKAELGGVPPISGTRSGLLDVIVNLILNAVDAMPAGGEIVISTESGDGCAIISVRDTGIGMDDETSKRVFEPFFTTKSDIGTGLGLSTVLATVSRWGGSVAVTSSPGHGAEFTISLPMSLQKEAEREDSAGPVRGRRARVLVVEDSEEIRSLLERLLSRSHEVTCVSDGERALEAFESERYDVALIDLGLAQIPGDAVGRILRQRDPAMATILISGWVLEDGDPRAKDFDFLLSKPFDDLIQIERVVANAVRARDSRTRDQG